MSFVDLFSTILKVIALRFWIPPVGHSKAFVFAMGPTKMGMASGIPVITV
jgi:hypothetical protein